MMRRIPLIRVVLPVALVALALMPARAVAGEPQPDAGAPIAVADIVRVLLADVPDSGVVIDVLANDRAPGGAPLQITDLGPLPFGRAELRDGAVVFDPPTGWWGTVEFRYRVADREGRASVGLVRVTIDRGVPETGALALGKAPPGIELDGLAAMAPSSGTDVLLASAFQSLHVLRVPLLLLGGALAVSLLLGGVPGRARLLLGSSTRVAVILIGHGERLEVLTEPGAGQITARLTATQRGLVESTRRTLSDGGEWSRVGTEVLSGWVPSVHLGEQVDAEGFRSDDRPGLLLSEFVARLRARRDFSDLVSRRGLFVSHHGPPIHFPAHRVAGLMEDATERRWRSREPADADLLGSFDDVVALGILDAFDHPARVIQADVPCLPSTVIPVEFTNLHYLAVGADLHGPERLVESAWLIVFVRESGRYRILGLVREG